MRWIEVRRLRAGHLARRGAVLLEVVLALVLFVGAAAIVGGAMHASIKTLDRSRLTLHASNLAVSVLSELQMGLRPATSGGPEPFPAPYEEWTWEIVAQERTELERPKFALVQVEVIIRHGFESIVHRVGQTIPASSSESVSEPIGESLLP